MRKLTAFTILELIIVLAIVGLVSGLAIYGFLTFRAIVETRQAVNEVITVTKETRNLAKNNVLPKTANTDLYYYAYVLTFDEANNLNRYLCTRPKVGAPVWTCPVATQEKLKSSLYKQINYSLVLNSSCHRILFENLTGDMLISKRKNYTFADADCILKLTHNRQPGAVYEVFFNGTSNTYGLVNE